MLVFLLAVDLLAAIFWVGGMAFAYWVLKPKGRDSAERPILRAFLALLHVPVSPFSTLMISMSYRGCRQVDAT